MADRGFTRKRRRWLRLACGAMLVTEGLGKGTQAGHYSHNNAFIAPGIRPHASSGSQLPLTRAQRRPRRPGTPLYAVDVGLALYDLNIWAQGVVDTQ
eukprot:55743-Eustigmatos_ZCMA.PRE.2